MANKIQQELEITVKTKLEELKNLQLTFRELIKTLESQGVSGTVLDKVIQAAMSLQGHIGAISKAKFAASSVEELKKIEGRIDILSQKFANMFQQAPKVVPPIPVRASASNFRDYTTSTNLDKDLEIVATTKPKDQSSLDAEAQALREKSDKKRLDSTRQVEEQELGIIKQSTKSKLDTKTRELTDVEKLQQDSYRNEVFGEQRKNDEIAKQRKAASTKRLNDNKEVNEQENRIIGQIITERVKAHVKGLKDIEDAQKTSLKREVENNNRLQDESDKRKQKIASGIKGTWSFTGEAEDVGNRIIEATSKVREYGKALNDLRGKSGESLRDVLKNMLPSKAAFIDALPIKEVESLGKAMDKAFNIDMKRAEIAAAGSSGGLGRALNNIRNSITDLMKWQIRWYATKFILMEPLRLMGEAFRTAGQYAIEVDNWRGKLLRWEATSGQVSESYKLGVEKMILSMRRLTLEIPITFDELGKSAEGFIGAGVPIEIVEKMLPTLAKLKAAFPAINMEQFGVALTGAWNSFKGSVTTIDATTGALVKATDAADEFVKIIEKMMVAQAKGIIRPEQFVQVMQHMSEMTKLAGMSIDEMLALSVAVTDLGSRTGSASRSVRGMLQDLAKKQKLLVELDIKFDPNKQLGPQLLPILKQLQEKVGGTNKVYSAKAMDVLSSIFSTERMKAATAIMNDVKKFTDLLETLQKAMGGVSLAAEQVTKTAGGQLVLLKSRFKELTEGVFGTQNIITGFLRIVNDAMLGALISLGDKAVMAKFSLKDLGIAGLTVYGILEGITGAFAPIVVTFQTLRDSALGFGNIIKSIGESLGLFSTGFMTADTAAKTFTTTLKILVSLIEALIIQSLVKWGAGWLAAKLAINAAEFAIASLIGKVKLLGIELKALVANNLPLLLMVLGFEGLQHIQYQKLAAIAKGFKDMGDAAGEAADKFKKLNDEQLKLEVTDLEKKLDELKAKKKGAKQTGVIEVEVKEMVPTKVGGDLTGGMAGALKKPTYTTVMKSFDIASTRGKAAMDALEQSISDVNTAFTAGNMMLAQRALGGKGEPGASVDKPEKEKQSISDKLSDIKREYEEKVRVVRLGEREVQDVLEQSRELGRISEEEYLNNSLKNTLEANEKEKAYRNAELNELTTTYKEKIGKIKKGEDQQNAWRDYSNAWEEISRKIVEIDTESKRLLLKNETGLEKNKREILKRTYEFEAEIYMMRANLANKLGDMQAAEEKKNRDNLYSLYKISATQFYKEEFDAAKENLNRKLTLIENERIAWYKQNQERIDRARELEREGGGDVVFVTEVNRDKLKADEKYLNDRTIVYKENSVEVKDIVRKGVEDLKIIFESSGIGGVISKVSENMSNAFGDIATNIKNSFETVMNTLESEFENLFDGLMEGTLDWQKAVSNVLKSMAKEIIKTFAIKPFMSGLTGMIGEKLKPKEGEEPSWLSKVFGSFGVKEKLNGTSVEKTANSTERTAIATEGILNEMRGGSLLGEKGTAANPFSESGITGTGKETVGLSDAFNNMVSDIKTQTEELSATTESCFSQLFSQIWGFIKRIGSAISGIFSGSGSGGSPFFGEAGYTSGYGGPPVEFGLAKGGRVQLNKRYLVGEQGPEVFSPDSSGTVIPNNKLFGGTPNTTVNVINQTSTPVDAKKSEVKFDGEKYVVNVVLKELTQNYGPLRHAVGGIRGR